jgi:hypothetical protein
MNMVFDDLAIDIIAGAAGVSKPRARKVMDAYREMELDFKIADIRQRTGKKPPCRLLGGCAVYDFPKTRIIRNPTPPEAA